MMTTAQAVLAAVILLAVIGAVLTFAVWIGLVLLAQHRKTQRIRAQRKQFELAKDINRLEHDLGFHGTPEDSCHLCHFDKRGYLPIEPDWQRR